MKVKDLGLPLSSIRMIFRVSLFLLEHWTVVACEPPSDRFRHLFPAFTILATYNILCASMVVHEYAMFGSACRI